MNRKSVSAFGAAVLAVSVLSAGTASASSSAYKPDYSNQVAVEQVTTSAGHETIYLGGNECVYDVHAEILDSSSGVAPHWSTSTDDTAGTLHTLRFVRPKDAPAGQYYISEILAAKCGGNGKLVPVFPAAGFEQPFTLTASKG